MGFFILAREDRLSCPGIAIVSYRLNPSHPFAIGGGSRDGPSNDGGEPSESAGTLLARKQRGPRPRRNG